MKTRDIDMTSQPDLAGLELSELEQALESRGIERFHARQLYRWIYKRGVTDFDRMTEEKVAGEHPLFALELHIAEENPAGAARDENAVFVGADDRAGRCL